MQELTPLYDVVDGRSSFCFAPYIASHRLRRDAQILPDTKVAQTLAGVLSSMFSLFAGFLISPAKVPDPWIWAYYLSPLHYVVEVRGPTRRTYVEAPLQRHVGAAFYACRIP